MSDGQSFQCWGHCLGMTQSVTHGPGHKMHSTRSGSCSINLVPAVANIRDHGVLRALIFFSKLRTKGDNGSIN